MAIQTNTFLVYSAKGVREDLTNEIVNISPEETPFVSNIGRSKAKSTLHEWQTDALTSAAANAKLEGEDYNSVGLDAVTATARIGNYVQISAKTVIISGTQDEVDKAGRKSELAYQVAKKGKELKRDVEFILLSNQGAVAGNSTTARKTGSILAFIKSNVSLGAGGVSPVWTTVPTDVRTDGTPRAFTETLLKTVVQACYTSGAELKLLLVGAAQKQVASTFAGIAAQRYNTQGAKPSTIIGAADIYVSDFGNLAIVPDRFMRAIDALLIDPSRASMLQLRPFMTTPLAKTGDAEKRLLLTEWGLKVDHEAAHGLVTDLS